MAAIDEIDRVQIDARHLKNLAEAIPNPSSGLFGGKIKFKLRDGTIIPLEALFGDALYWRERALALEGSIEAALERAEMERAEWGARKAG